MSQINLTSDIQQLFTSGTPMVKILNDFVQALLHNPDSSLTTAERQIIANYASTLNECETGMVTPDIATEYWAENDWETTENRATEQDSASMSDKLKALLKVAAKVQQSGNAVTDCDIEAARWQGASNQDIHDTILIAAAFGMYSRYAGNMATAIIT